MADTRETPSLKGLMRLADQLGLPRQAYTELHRAGTELERLRSALEGQEKLLASGEASDGYHTHRELYEYRMLYNAHAVNGWRREDDYPVVKSWRHSDGELCFGGGWFIVVAELPTGQVSNHYREEHWHLFDVPEVEAPPEYDGHTPADVAVRLRRALAGADTGESR